MMNWNQFPLADELTLVPPIAFAATKPPLVHRICRTLCREAIRLALLEKLPRENVDAMTYHRSLKVSNGIHVAGNVVEAFPLSGNSNPWALQSFVTILDILIGKIDLRSLELHVSRTTFSAISHRSCNSFDQC